VARARDNDLSGPDAAEDGATITKAARHQAFPQLLEPLHFALATTLRRTRKRGGDPREP
jgi:hypothetical protein